MGIGIRIRKLWHMKPWVALGVLVAIAAAILSIYRLTLSPLALAPRSLDMASATAHVLVDTPDSVMVDLRADTYSLEDLSNRAVVLGNVMTSTVVEAGIARRAHVPPGLLRIEAPLTPQEAALPVTQQNQRKITDILKSNNQYRLNLQVDPTVPMLDIYAQAPSASSAAALANGAATELSAYLSSVAKSENTPAKQRLRLDQLGRATGAVINHGVEYQVAVLAFVLVFLAWCATAVFVARIRQGWRVAAAAEGTAGP